MHRSTNHPVGIYKVIHAGCMKLQRKSLLILKLNTRTRRRRLRSRRGQTIRLGNVLSFYSSDH